MGIDVETYYRTYGPMVLRRCRYLLGDEDRALDALQETFVRILRKKESLKGTGPSSLLYVTATRVCLNMIRSEKRGPKRVDPEVLQHIPGRDNPADRLCMLETLDILLADEKTRLIAVLRYLDGFTLEETAEQVGMSVSGVRKRMRNLKAAGLTQKEAYA
ncbi:MAG: sigma-70 family RNA polymerase sigma factor [Spirochaetales bacterium]|nr:sigma-70 family RNA polymerase sigma factor [Spirochaetales bacterium]